MPDFDMFKNRAQSEYPKAIITQKNLEDAYLLQSDYASKNSETTAIMTYAYQSYLIKPYSEEIAKIVEKIGITEMMHHEILADMIVKSGGNPVIGANGSYWYGGYVDYAQNIFKMLKNNIAAESEAIKNYEQTIAYLNNKTIVPVIQRIIEDEKIHIETFEKLLKYVEDLNNQAN